MFQIQKNRLINSYVLSRLTVERYELFALRVYLKQIARGVILETVLTKQDQWNIYRRNMNLQLYVCDLRTKVFARESERE